MAPNAYDLLTDMLWRHMRHILGTKLQNKDLVSVLSVHVTLKKCALHTKLTPKLAQSRFAVVMTSGEDGKKRNVLCSYGERHQ